MWENGMRQGWKLKTLVYILCFVFLGLTLKESAVVLGASSSVPAPAQASETDERVLDFAGLFEGKAERKLSLDRELQRLEAEYGLFLVVLLTPDHTVGEDASRFADDYYDAHFIAQKPDGLILLVDFGKREWALSTSGRAIDAFTDYGQEALMEQVLPRWKKQDFLGGLETFVQALEPYLKAAQQGKPIDRHQRPRKALGRQWIVYSILAALLLGLLASLGMMRSLKPVRPQKGARDYVPRGLRLSRNENLYLYSQHRMVAKPEPSSGGSSTHSSSSGYTHGGSSGKF